MSHEFTFTPSDIYRIILAVAGLIVSVAGAAKVIYSIIEKAKQPEKNQNDRITSLESRVTEIERTQKASNGFQKISEDWMLCMSESIFDMMNHMIDGNNTEELKKTRNKMQRYITMRTITRKEGDYEQQDL